MRKLLIPGNSVGKTHKHNYVFAYANRKLTWKFCNLCGKIRPRDSEKYLNSCKRLKLNEFAINCVDDI